jgi:hypothetical protein
MIFRLTQKVSNKLRIPCEELAQSSASMLEWYCHLVVAQRRQFFLFTQAATLFSFWAPAAGYSRGEFSPMFRRRATDALRDYGFSDDDVAKLIDDGPDVFARSVDRGVVGSMADYAKMFRHAVDHEGGLERLGPRSMNNIANECPMSRIGMESPLAISARSSEPGGRITPGRWADHRVE